MLLTFVVLYLVLSIAVGLVASLRVHSTRDYVVAGLVTWIALEIAAPRRASSRRSWRGCWRVSRA